MDGTEQSLRDETSAEGEAYDAHISLQPLLAGDIIIVRVKTKATATATKGLLYQATYKNAQTAPEIYVPAVTVAKEWELTLQQILGTYRTIKWSIYK